MLRAQLRALVRASGGRPIRVMFPMVTCVSEFDAARRLLDMELARGEREGRPLPDDLKVGVMMVVPALLWQLHQSLPRIAFLSVGSNDLMQDWFAPQPGDPKLARPP